MLSPSLSLYTSISSWCTLTKSWKTQFRVSISLLSWHKVQSPWAESELYARIFSCFAFKRNYDKQITTNISHFLSSYLISPQSFLFRFKSVCVTISTVPPPLSLSLVPSVRTCPYVTRVHPIPELAPYNQAKYPRILNMFKTLFVRLPLSLLLCMK